MKVTNSGLTVLFAAIALCSAFYLPQTKRPFDLIGVKFCPKTANTHQINATKSQRELDKKYCSYEHKLLKEVWNNKQFEALQPLPESSFIFRSIPSVKSNHLWYLVSPVAMGIAYLSYAKKCEYDEASAYLELEGFKTTIKFYGTNSREERDFKTQVIKTSWDKQRVKAGLISVEAMQDKLRRQEEIQDKTHASTLKQFTAADAEMDKKIAENLRDKHKADKESQKILGNKNIDIESNNSDSTNLKLDEKYHWIYKLLKLPFRVLSGEQGSGKSTLERLMIRLLKDNGYHIIIINPETNLTSCTNIF